MLKRHRIVKLPIGWLVVGREIKRGKIFDTLKEAKAYMASLRKTARKIMAAKKIGISSVKKVSKIPKGYKKTIGATTSPIGYVLYDNGKSRFSGKKKYVLVKERRK